MRNYGFVQEELTLEQTGLADVKGDMADGPVQLSGHHAQGEGEAELGK